jgi:hypothetical protein
VLHAVLIFKRLNFEFISLCFVFDQGIKLSNFKFKFFFYELNVFLKEFVFVLVIGNYLFVNSFSLQDVFLHVFDLQT